MAGPMMDGLSEAERRSLFGAGASAPFIGYRPTEENERIGASEIRRERGQGQADRDGVTRVGITQMSDAEYEGMQDALNREHADVLKTRADKLGRKGDLKAQKRAADLDWRKDAYRTSFGELYEQSRTPYYEAQQRARGYIDEGDEIFSDAVGSYQDVLSGAAPSQAELAVMEGADRAAQTGMSLAASGRGNPAMAMREAQRAAAEGGQEAAQKAGDIRLQETAAARGALLGAGQGRSAQGNATMFEATGTLTDNLADERNATSKEFHADRQRADQRRDARTQAAIQGVGMGLQAVGGATGSDRDAKKDIKPGGDAIEALLDSIEPSTYKYKDPEKHGDGKRAGVMAQDLQKSDLGSTLVSEDDDGTLMVDYDRANPIMMAALANIHRRLSEVE